MREVKRYCLSEFSEPNTYPVGPGSYVATEVYDALHAEAEALRAENAKLRTALAEQGERQEAVAWTVAYPPEYKPFMHHLSFGSESEAARYAQQKTPKAMGCVVVALYTTPQPGPDVRWLVEALGEAAAELEDWRMSFPDANATVTDVLLVRIDGLIVAHRQAQRKGEQP